MTDALDHPRVDDEHFVDRYLAGKLTPEDEGLFEEHLFACTPCLEQVESEEDLRWGLRTVAARDAARATATLGVIAWLGQRSAAQRAGLAAIALVFILLPAALLWQHAELSRLRERPLQIAAANGLDEPLADFSVVSLGVVRDATEPVVIQPDPDRSAILLSLELTTVTAARFRVTLHRATGEVLWRGDDLEPNLYDTLLLALPSSFLAPGRYRITVEGVSPAGSELVGEMRFRVP